MQVKKKIYMAVTADKYELPLFIADHLNDLAKEFHTTRNSVITCICNKTNGRKSGVKFLKEEIWWDETDEIVYNTILPKRKTKYSGHSEHTFSTPIF
ncbi:MAG: hypothetical protein Q8873_00375 [Bacillota bacterium]|nr:hypothetical protein [Bacillota bacterium]